MKFTKMSLVAALLIGSSAFALDNVKVSGNAKLFYSTSDATSTGVKAGVNADSTVGKGAKPAQLDAALKPLTSTDNSLFSSPTSAGQASLGLGVTADLMKNVSAGAHMTALTTLGLQGQLVGNVWEGTNGTQDTYWFDQAWVAGTLGKTTAKVGRMELDTPLAFSEQWSVAENTFESAVVINQDIPDTTLVGAYVGAGNGSAEGKTALQGAGVGIGNVIGAQNPNGESNFNTYHNGAYAIGAINNSWKPLTAQAWYYDLTRFATAYWLQADLDASSLGVDGLTMGGQYVGETAKDGKANSAVAAMVGYAMKDMFSAKLAYSVESSQGTLAGAGQNTATATAASKLYTEAWWSYGQVTLKGAKAINLTVEAPTPYADLGLYITNVDQKAKNSDLTEVTVTASKSFGALDTSLAYINTSLGNGAKTGSTNTNMLQAFLTLNF